MYLVALLYLIIVGEGLQCVCVGKGFNYSINLITNSHTQLSVLRFITFSNHITIHLSYKTHHQLLPRITNIYNSTSSVKSHKFEALIINILRK
jgi:hypothetical protein